MLLHTWKGTLELLFGGVSHNKCNNSDKWARTLLAYKIQYHTKEWEN